MKLTRTDILVLVAFAALGLLAVTLVGSYPIGVIAIGGMVLTALNAFMRTRRHPAQPR